MCGSGLHPWEGRCEAGVQMEALECDTRRTRTLGAIYRLGGFWYPSIPITLKTMLLFTFFFPSGQWSSLSIS